MIWPPPNDFRDAVRNPAASFADPDLAACDAVVGANGLPDPHAGNASRVYQLCAEDGRSWAVKCFTRIDDARAARYAAVRAALAGKSFAVNFDYLPEGAQIAGRRWPVLKMDWVEGQTLQQVAKERANSPAVMDGLFKRWVQLARELRAAGIAHGDLQHANVLLVSGKWPGSYTLKLIDYDAMYLPDLADRPTYETGNPNYQHPERNERSYGPDLDRFSFLAIATALKALAVRGPDLWRAYAVRDGLLFTAGDFRDPAASRVLRKLWKNGDPGLRALVGKLVLACGQPLAQTPWLDDLCANGAPALTDDEARAVDATLRAPTTAGAFTLDDEDADLIPAEVVAFTLDDEPEPVAPKPRPVVEGKPVPVAARPAPLPPEPEPPRAKPLTPVPVVTDGDDEEEPDPRPRRKPRREPEPTRGFPWIAVAILLGFMMVAGAIAAGYLMARAEKPAEAAQAQPQPSDAPKSQPNPTPAPAPAPNPIPPEPVFAGPPSYHRVWTKPAGSRPDVRPFFAADGRTVYAAIDNRIDAFDAKTGDPRPGLRGQVPQLALGLWALPNDRVAVFGMPHKAPRLWDAKTGDPLPFLSRDPLPPPPPGVNDGLYECRVSPDGRYVFAGYQGPVRGTASAPAPFRVVDAATGNAVASGDWTFGMTRFAGDRLLMVETSGRVRWIDLRTGESEVEWAFPPGPPWLRGATDDGSLFVYTGRPVGLAFDSYLMDGRTGQPLRRIGPHFLGESAALSPDGRYLAGIINEPPQFRERVIVLTDARTGEVLVRTPLDGTTNDFPRVSFTPDGRKLALHHRTKNELQVYELRGAVPNSSAPEPAAVGPVPPRARPGDFAAGAPVPPVPPPPPPNDFPAAPALKVLWKGVAAAPMANALPQAPLFTPDGKTLVLSGGTSGTVLTFDAKTGDAGPVFEGHKGPGGVYWVAVAGNDRVVSGGFDAKQTTWDIKTGKPVDAIKFPDLPPMAPGVPGHAGITYGVSPGGRYTVQARREVRGAAAPGPLRVLDTTTGKEVLSGDWNGGRVLFTADESRALVVNGLGKAAWYKLPSGEADGGWEIGAGARAEQARVLGASADGEKVLYHGTLAGQPIGVFLLEGRTGRVIRKLNTGAPYQASFSALSPDGKSVAMGVIDFARNAQWHVDVFEADGWRVIGRASSPDGGGVREVPQFAFTPDGKGLSVLFPTAKELLMFGLPDR